MRQLTLFGPGDLRLIEKEKPKPGPGEALVKIKACAICTLEQRIYKGLMKIFYPVVPGHEASGVVEGVGEETLTSLKPGMKVALDLIYRCGECYWCRIGQSNHCQFRFSKEVPTLGGFSDYIVVKTKQCFPVPDSVPDIISCLSEPLACCIHSLRSINLSFGEDLLIVGAGTMGLIHLLLGKMMGARVFISDPLESRLNKARELGADRVISGTEKELRKEIDELTEGRGVDACIITAPNEGAFRSGINALRKGGRISVYSAYTEEFDVPVNANYLHRSEISVIGVEGRTEKDFLLATRLISFGTINLFPLVSSIFSPEEGKEAIEKAGSPESYRVIIDFSK
ncbi:MAG: zinc-dependent alcohol dehydrogenase [bacterium]